MTDNKSTSNLIWHNETKIDIWNEIVYRFSFALCICCSALFAYIQMLCMCVWICLKPKERERKRKSKKTHTIKWTEKLTVVYHQTAKFSNLFIQFNQCNFVVCIGAIFSANSSSHILNTFLRLSLCIILVRVTARQSEFDKFVKCLKRSDSYILT